MTQLEFEYVNAGTTAVENTPAKMNTKPIINRFLWLTAASSRAKIMIPTTYAPRINAATSLMPQDVVEAEATEKPSSKFTKRQPPMQTIPRTLCLSQPS